MANLTLLPRREGSASVPANLSAADGVTTWFREKFDLRFWGLHVALIRSALRGSSQRVGDAFHAHRARTFDQHGAAGTYGMPNKRNDLLNVAKGGGSRRHHAGFSRRDRHFLSVFAARNQAIRAAARDDFFAQAAMPLPARRPQLLHVAADDDALPRRFDLPQ